MLKYSPSRGSYVPVAVFLGVPILLSCGCSSPAPSEAPATSQVSTPAPSAPADTLPAPVAPSFEHRMIRRTGNTPEDAKVYVVEGGKKHWVVNATWFATHGYHFPGDVQVIPVGDFAAIPTGDPIQ